LFPHGTVVSPQNSVNAVVMAAAGADAQNISKGDWFLNGQFSSLELAHTFMDEFSSTSLNVAANGGCYPMGNLLPGSAVSAVKA
jgi:hypothetical protein